jgi:Outer membrane lipoprotein-sorting protein
MRKIVISSIWTILCLFIIIPYCSADEQKARLIMQQVEDRDDGDNMVSDMLMVLIDKNNKERKKYFQNFSKDFGKDNKRIMFVKSPAQIKNTGFLTFDYDDESLDDDQWLFLPAVGKTKRIASTDKSSSFMGSDLNYSDMTGRNLEDYDYKLLKESKLNGRDVWLIQSLPRTKEVEDETGYKKAILAVRKDNYVVVRAKMWTSEGGFTKYMDAKKLELIQGIWVVTKNHITKKQGSVIKHQTLLKLSNIKFNQNFDENIFTIRRLEKGLF